MDAAAEPKKEELVAFDKGKYVCFPSPPSLPFDLHTTLPSPFPL